MFVLCIKYVDYVKRLNNTVTILIDSAYSKKVKINFGTLRTVGHFKITNSEITNSLLCIYHSRSYSNDP